MQISQSTISGNSAANGGGGIYTLDGLTQVADSTITHNIAPANRGAGVAGSDGQTFLGSSTSAFSRSIVSGNNGTDVDIVTNYAFFVSNGDNLVGSGNATSRFYDPGDQTGVTHPGLAALADNGGPTRTHALLGGSPAIDAVVGNCAQPTDQRGAPRPAGSACDIGAFEFGSAPAAVVASLTLVPANASHLTLENQCVTVAAETSVGAPVPNVNVAFARTGPNPGMQTVATDTAGQAQHCWTGVNGGVDHVIATFGNLVSNESVITWNKRLTSIAPEAVTVTLALGQPLLKLAPTATLKDTVSNAPIAGRTVQFSAGATLLCSATTGATGVVKCNATLSSTLGSVLSQGYTAKFSGDTTYKPIEKKGPPLIIKLGL